MEMYFLKSAACLAILMIFYKLLLEKENMHVFKRWYLLAAVLISFVIPWITFTIYSEPVAAESAVVLQPDFDPAAEPITKGISYFSYFLWSLYGIGVLFFGVKFVLNLRIILLRIKKNPKIRAGKTTNVLLQERLAPHTFWDYIFLNKQKYEEKEIPEEVFQHEQAHAAQRHSADILLMELLQIIFWFHPLLYMVKKAIRLNHEFLADSAVLKKGIQPALYQKTLLAFSSNVFDSSLVNPINYQSIKKRFTVMRTNTSRKMVWTKSLVLLPLLAVLVFSFSTKETLIKTSSSDELQQKTSVTILPSGDTIVIAEDINIRMLDTKHLVLNGNTISYDELPAFLGHFNSNLSPAERNSMVSAEIITKEEFPTGKVNDIKRALYHYGISRAKVTLAGTPEGKVSTAQDTQDKQEKATPQMIEEYNKWAKEINEGSQKVTTVKKETLEKMHYIYSIMTPRQKEDSEKFPDRLKEISGISAEQERAQKIEERRIQREEINEKRAEIRRKQVEVRREESEIRRKEAEARRRNREANNKERRRQKDSVPPPVEVIGHPATPPPPSRLNENSPPLPPPVEVTGYPSSPPPPPPPPSPIEAVQDWIDEGADFFYNGKAISDEEALELVKKNNGKNLSVQVIKDNSGTTVRLLDKKE